MEIGPWTFGGFDVVVFVILGFSGVLAFARGLSREIISILALLIALAGALFIFGRYSVSAQDFIKPVWLANATLSIGVFGLFYLIITFILRGWAKSIRGRTPGFFDRLLGLGFGLTRGTILASLFVIGASNLAKDGEPADWMTQTTTYPMLRKVADTLQALPFARIRETAEEIKSKGENSDILPDIPTDTDIHQSTQEFDQ